MSASIRPHIIGNWKMNGLFEQLNEIRLLDEMIEKDGQKNVCAIICPPATLLFEARRVGKFGNVELGGQDCHQEKSGAYTGDISALMLKDAGAQFVIVGHSERRSAYNESDEIVKNKAKAALKAGLTPIICLGESKEEREQGRAQEIVLNQLSGSIPAQLEADIIVAYEPVWAIGTGLVPSLSDIDEIHNAIRAELKKLYGARGQITPILYGGSMKPDNAKDILALQNVNGGLVGGASLRAKDFIQIIKSA